MSRDITVLTPNGRRAKVHCTPDTNMLQVLEDVCSKHGFQPSDYNLKHHNKILDLSSTMRFSNLPNKACLEMVEVDRKRTESNVTIGLTLDDGERRTADFTPSTTLYDLIIHLAAKELQTLTNPAVSYMRQDVVGIVAMKDKTLRQLGLLGGRAMLRLFNKLDEPTQANVSAVYKVPLKEEPKVADSVPSSSKTSPVTNDPLRKIKEKICLGASSTVQTKPENHDFNQEPNVSEEPSTMEVEEPVTPSKEVNVKSSAEIQANLERRLKIEEEVTFLGDNKAIVYMQPEGDVEELEDLPDDFYDLTVEEVRRLYHDLHKKRMDLENKPLLTSVQKDTISEQSSQYTMGDYKNAVVRIQFPDSAVLQGVFQPTDTIKDVMNFIKVHLATPDKPFLIFTTPLKETLDPRQTLSDARFVPGVHMHFKWLNESAAGAYLKSDIYTRTTPSDAANILASKYRAPSRRKIEDVAAPSSKSAAGSSSTGGKVPKWFKK